MKIGIVSFAHLHSEFYSSVLTAHFPADYVGVLETDPERAARYGPQCGVPVYPSWDSFLSTGAEAVILCSENSSHGRDARLATTAGLHVLCEKPLETTTEKAAAIVADASRAGVVLMTAFPVRFSPVVQRARAQLLAGELGSLTSVVSANQGQVPGVHRSWFLDEDSAGGGAVTDHTVHLVDILRWLTGSEVAEVYAVANRIVAATETNLETAGIVSLRFENGVTASIDCSWSRPPAYPAWGGLDLRLVTDRGIVEIDPFAGRFASYGGGADAVQLVEYGPDINAAMIMEFIDACISHRDAAVTGVDGLRAVEVVSAAYRSIERGRPVTVDRTKAAL